MKNIFNKKETEEAIDCLFVKKSNCLILRSKECKNCKFYKKNTSENYQKYIKNIKTDIKNYALKHNQ